MARPEDPVAVAVVTLMTGSLAASAAAVAADRT